MLEEERALYDKIFSDQDEIRKAIEIEERQIDAERQMT